MGRDGAIRLCLLLLVVTGVVAWAGSLRGALVFDDLYHLVELDRISGFADIWGQRPLTTLTLAINHRIGGLEPRGYHVVNVAVHLLAALALFGLVRRTLELPGFGQLSDHAHWYALAIAMLWMVHPLQTQSVTYVIQRAESLMGLFYLLTLYCFVRGYAATRPAAWYAAAVAACALGMGSKAVMVTAPLLVLLLDWAVLSRSARLVRDRWPVHAGLFATWGVLLATGLPGLLGGGPGRSTIGFAVTEFTPLEYLLTQGGVILHYLELAVWPRHLCLDYVWPPEQRPAVIAATVAAVGAAGVLSVIGLWKRPGPGFLGAAFFLLLAPTSSVVPAADAAVEHRMYLPLACVIALAVFAGVAAARRLAPRLSWSPATQRATIAAALVAVTTALSARTIARNREYAEPERLWEGVVELRPSNARAWVELGNQYARHDVELALAVYRRAVQANPRYFVALANLGNALRAAGHPAEALPINRRAVELRPDMPQARLALANTLTDLGELDEAIPLLREIVRERPYQADFRTDLGRALMLASGLGDDRPSLRDEPSFNEAVLHLAEAVRLGSRDGRAAEYLAHGLARAGDIDRRVEPVAEVPGIERVRADAWTLHASAELRRDRIEDARRSCARALSIDPDHPAALELQRLVQQRRTLTAAPGGDR